MSKALAIHLCFASVLVLGILTLGQEVYDPKDDSRYDGDYMTICRINDRQGLCSRPYNCPFPQIDVQESIPLQCESRDGVARVCCVSPSRRKLHPRPPGCSLPGECKEDLIKNRLSAFCSASYAANGKDSESGEFPHMALLGYQGHTTKFSDILWQCGGTVISFRFVLTAGHCTVDRARSTVTHVAVGLLKRSEVEPSSAHRVKKIHNHPDYKSPRKYHDIAILEMDNNMLVFNFRSQKPRVFPACLVDEDSDLDDSEAIATGWGALGDMGDNADILQKVTLRKYEDSVCSLSATHIAPRFLSKGIDLDTQICYGDNVTKMDTCRGDSGGPLHIKNDDEKSCYDCKYKIIGITSYGQRCAETDVPGVYTRVAAYLPWINSIVWPPKEQPIQAHDEKIVQPKVGELKNRQSAQNQNSTVGHQDEGARDEELAYSNAPSGVSIPRPSVFKSIFVYY